MRGLLVLIGVAGVTASLAACGTEGVDVDDPAFKDGAELFAERCSGCHTLKVAGAEGSANRSQRTQGPNFDERKESYEDAIFAIRNGGFSGAIMPQNIVVGEDAEKVARFLERYSGQEIDVPARPGQPAQ